MRFRYLFSIDVENGDTKARELAHAKNKSIVLATVNAYDVKPCTEENGFEYMVEHQANLGTIFANLVERRLVYRFSMELAQ